MAVYKVFYLKKNSMYIKINDNKIIIALKGVSKNSFYDKTVM